MANNTVILTLDYLYALESQSDIDNTVYQLARELASLWREPRLEYGQKSSFISHLLQKGVRIIDNIQPLREVIANLNENHLDGFIELCEPKIYGELMTVVIKGAEDFVNYARSKVLTTYNYVVTKEIPLSPADFLQISSLEVGPVFLKSMEAISSALDVEYIISTRKIDFYKIQNTVKENDFGIGFHSTTSFNLYIIGNQDNITAAETQIRVVINAILNEFYVDTYEIDLSLIPLLGGIDMLNFTQIARQLDCNIYIPDLLPELLNSDLLANNRAMLVYITAKEIASIHMAKYLLDDLKLKLVHSETSLVSKSVCMFKTKLDLMVLIDQAYLLSIMFKYGVFIQLPSLGSLNDFEIQVQGQFPESVMEAIHELCLLSSKYYQYTVKFDKSSISNSNQFDQLLSALASNEERPTVTSSSENGIEFFGTAEQLKHFVILLDTNFFKHFSAAVEMSFTLEINNEHKDFISGKKNGKVMKVLNQLGQIPRIEFLAFNEEQFLLVFTVSSRKQNNNIVVPTFLKGLDLLNLELPAELKFNIPEVFHKSIIGNGGSIIQAIMKKHNVFIKFTSHKMDEDQRLKKDNDNKLLYSFQRFENVLVKCPNKNANSIPFVKSEIDELVRQCCLSNVMGHSFHPNASSTTYLTTYFKLLKSQYQLFVNTHNLREINQIEADTTSFIDFPKSITDFGDQDHITFIIKGADDKSKQAATSLALLLPRIYRITLAQNPGKFEEFLSEQSPEFKHKIQFALKMLMNVEVSTVQEGSSAIEVPKYHLILLHYYDATKLATAVDVTTNYLRNKNFLILDKAEFDLDNIVDVLSKSENISYPNFMAMAPYPVSNETKKLKLITNTSTNNPKSKGGQQEWKSKRKPRKGPQIKQRVMA